MRVLAGLSLGGPLFLERQIATLGGPAWGPLGLLRDLELRLGIAPIDESNSLRIPRWTARIKSLSDDGAFYRRSFIVDELGTASKLLEWRDALVEAGWNGGAIPGGGERLDALSALESHEEMSIGRADRLVLVERALACTKARLYDSITLLEDQALWPKRWRDTFRLLEARGTSVHRFASKLAGAPSGSDLGLLQARLRGEKTTASIRGDGTLLLLRGDTPSDLAELTASMLARGRRRKDVVLRCRDPESLESALARHGVPAQGCASESVWRPATQVLPLAVELAFEPRDPFRVLELLTLSVGPFRGLLGTRLARAVARQPGIGGKEWELQKEEGAIRLREQVERGEREKGASEADAARVAQELVDERLQRVATWLEGPAAPASGATREGLLSVVERVRHWLQGRLRGGELEVYGAAYTQAVAFAEAIARDERDLFTQIDARQLFDRFARTAQPHAMSTESAGRVTHLDHPAAFLAPCDRLFFWSFVAGVERRPPRLPWNEEERAALFAAGVDFPDPSALLRVETEHWRRAVLAARERVVFVFPRTIKGTPTALHPLWDEICARLSLDETKIARITRDARAMLGPTARPIVPVAPCPPLPLPEGRGSWLVPSWGLRPSRTELKSTSVTSLEKIAICPLAWVLEHRAALRSGAMSKVAAGPLLNGGLAHRLVEILFKEEAFSLAEDAFLVRATIRFEDLLQREGATILLAGASIERLQLTRQVNRSMRDLYRYLRDGKFRIVSVEEVVTTESSVGPVHGRMDLRLVDDDGQTAILDLKWGATSYRALLEQGRAVQLAVYVRAVAESEKGTTTAPPAAYFALSRGILLSTDRRMKPTQLIDGPSLDDTWRRIETTIKAVLESHAKGIVFVSGAKRSLPLLDALGIPQDERDQHFKTPQDAACGYCDYDALCGRKWAALA